MIMETPIQKQFYPTIWQSFKLIIRMVLISVPMIILLKFIGDFLKKYFNQGSDLIDSSILLVVYVIPFLIIIRLGLKRPYSNNLGD